MKPVSIEQIKKACDQHGYKMGILLDPSGTKCIPGHTVSTKPKKWLEEKVKPYLSRTTIPQGIYVVKMFNDHNMKTPPEIYPVQVGEVEGSGDGKVNVIINSGLADHARENVLSYDSALKLQVENAELKLKLDALEKKLNGETPEGEDEDEDEDEDEGLADEGPQHWLADALPGIVSGLEMLFKDRDEARKLEYARILSTNPGMAQNPYFMQYVMPTLSQAPPQQQNPGAYYQQQQQSQAQQKYMQRADEFFKLLAQNDPIAFERVQKLLQGLTDPNQFYVKLKEAEPEIYADMDKYITAA